MSQKRSMSDGELAAFEASHDFEALLVQSARELGAGKTRMVYAPVVAPRMSAALHGGTSMHTPQRCRCEAQKATANLLDLGG